jgi:hypothetical protein
VGARGGRAVGPVEGWTSLGSRAMCIIHRWQCKCFKVRTRKDGSYRIVFGPSGHHVCNFGCDKEAALAIVRLLNRWGSICDTIFHVGQVLGAVKNLEDVENDRLFRERLDALADIASGGDPAAAERLKYEALVRTNGVDATSA